MSLGTCAKMRINSNIATKRFISTIFILSEWAFRDSAFATFVFPMNNSISLIISFQILFRFKS